jgi:hypothetical protein
MTRGAQKVSACPRSRSNSSQFFLFLSFFWNGSLNVRTLGSVNRGGVALSFLSFLSFFHFFPNPFPRFTWQQQQKSITR